MHEAHVREDRHQIFKMQSSGKQSSKWTSSVSKYKTSVQIYKNVTFKNAITRPALCPCMTIGLREFSLTRGQERECVRWVRKGWRLWGIQWRRCHLSSWPQSFSYWETLNAAGAWSGTPCMQQSNDPLLQINIIKTISWTPVCECLLTSGERFLVCWTSRRPSLLLCSLGCLPLCTSLHYRLLTAITAEKSFCFTVKWKQLKGDVNF